MRRVVSFVLFGMMCWPAGASAAAEGAASVDPAVEFAEAKAAFDRGEWKSAVHLCERFVKRYWHDPVVRERNKTAFRPETEEAQVLAARAWGKLDDPMREGEAWGKLGDINPASRWIQEAGVREFEIADYFYTRSDKLWVIRRETSQNAALKFYERGLLHFPGSEKAETALFRSGEIHHARGEYELAEDAFRRLAEEYPKSLIASQGDFLRALCFLARWNGPDYDPVPARDAMHRLNLYLLKYPEGAEKPKVAGELKTLVDKLAKKDFDTARFYAHRRKQESALVYYREVIRRYPGTEWAEKAKALVGEDQPETRP